MNQILELFPIIVFVAAWVISQDALLATLVLMLATAMQMGLMALLKIPFSKMHKVTFALVFGLGAATLIFSDEHFIQWKLSLIYWIFASALIIGHLFKKNYLRQMFEAMLAQQQELEVNMKDAAWHRLSIIFIVYFIAIGCANAYVTLQFDFEAWVTFKVVIFVVTLFLFPATLLGFILKQKNKQTPTN